MFLPTHNRFLWIAAACCLVILAGCQASNMDGWPPPGSGAQVEPSPALWQEPDAPPPSFRYVAYTVYEQPFELEIPAAEWHVSEDYYPPEDYLVSNSIPGCRVLLREGAREYDCTSTAAITAAQREWSICPLSSIPDFVIYSTLYDGGGALFRVILPADGAPQVRDECRRRAEAVLDSFRPVPEGAD